ncbi:hypothetical protein P6709_01710 [Jeotgalibacillus sp. ET6]|uniref:hypothetical protein n=1 Tax=Jeotgalibacillus sp. ET6 TaxID=3037260 RepID=UPI0024181B32|nr:hypothetical protein [Jeotgalibacillus sp. ET6]MDG5470445.1 hypothetical protein [Jeotgalibacillus sp. ET6]
MALYTGIVIIVLSVCLLYWQLKREHEKRNVILLFIFLTLFLFGLWIVFDWLIMQVWQ